MIDADSLKSGMDYCMIEVVKRDKGVTLEYMKIFEREQMLREERVNTERERQRAERAEAKLRELLGDKELAGVKDN